MMQLNNFMTLMFMTLLMIIVGCSGEDGKDGKVNVILKATNGFKAGAYSFGCLIISDTQTACNYYVDGTRYTDNNITEELSHGDNSITYVSPNTQFSDIESGAHTYCLTTDSSTDCLDGITGEFQLTANSGKSGSTGITPENGEDGMTSPILLHLALQRSLKLKNK